MDEEKFQEEVSVWLNGLRNVFLTLKDSPEEMATVAAAMVGLSIMLYPDLQDTLRKMLDEAVDRAS